MYGIGNDVADQVATVANNVNEQVQALKNMADEVGINKAESMVSTWLDSLQRAKEIEAERKRFVFNGRHAAMERAYREFLDYVPAARSVNGIADAASACNHQEVIEITKNKVLGTLLKKTSEMNINETEAIALNCLKKVENWKVHYPEFMSSAASIGYAKAYEELLHSAQASRALNSIADAAKYACSWEYRFFKPMREKSFSALQSAQNFFNNNKKVVLGATAVALVGGVGTYLYKNGYFNFGKNEADKTK